MSQKSFRVVKCPTDELAVTNCAILNIHDFNAKDHKHIEIIPGTAHRYVFSFANHPQVNPGEIAFASTQRQWAMLSLCQEVRVRAFEFQLNQHIGALTVSVDFQKKKEATPEPLDSDAMAREFLMQFSGKAFTKGEKRVFSFPIKQKEKIITLSINVKNIEGIDLAAAARGGDSKASTFPLDCGQLLANSAIVFDREEGTQINLIGKSKGKAAYRSLINPDWDYEKMGIGGLDKEFADVFRRVFASRVFPPEFIEQLGMKHTRGILLYGPPGTGKTLMARQIGKMLNAREPKIVNGPQILDKYVGESESNIRKLFADAEEEWKRCGSNSGLHIIIFDEIDAICKQRGSMAGSSSVHDTVVNQLLSKMDGVDQLNNILVIGMTNRKDMIDEALLRPGRLEVQMEVSLPDEHGRVQIFKIHTARMREYNKLDSNVDLLDLSKRTKNFSGAEIEGLVRAAQSSAMNRLVRAGGKVQLDPNAIEKLMITVEDFDHALEHDVKPAFGRSEEQLDNFLRGGLVIWGPEVSSILEKGELLAEVAKNRENGRFVTAVFAGLPGTGKSCLAATIAKRSEFPFVKVVSPVDMGGFSESAKCMTLRKAFDDALRSKLSVLIIDDLERLIDYSPVGPRYSNLVLQALLVFLKMPPPKDHRLLVLATSSNRSFLRELELLSAFGRLIDIPVLSKPEQIMTVVAQSEAYVPSELSQFESRLAELFSHSRYGIGIKTLLDLIDFSKQCEQGCRAETLFDELQAVVLGLE
ncbi:unnamed protein product [Auanema sp. JU1783]|nr:unnamed protein product [Auanema sp. JU1783]